MVITSSYNTLSKQGRVSCHQPSSRSEGWSLHGQVYSAFFCLVFFNRSSNGIPVHSFMLTIHRILGFPCFLAPRVVHCMISFSRQSPFLITCPKYDNFLLLIMLSSPRSILAVSNTHSFVFFLAFFVCISSQMLQF